MAVNAALYPTFAYSDVPERWVQGVEQAAGQLKAGVDDQRKTLLTVLEAGGGAMVLGRANDRARSLFYDVAILGPRPQMVRLSCTYARPHRS